MAVPALTRSLSVTSGPPVRKVLTSGGWVLPAHPIVPLSGKTPPTKFEFYPQLAAA